MERDGSQRRKSRAFSQREAPCVIKENKRAVLCYSYMRALHYVGIYKQRTIHHCWLHYTCGHENSSCTATYFVQDSTFFAKTPHTVRPYTGCMESAGGPMFFLGAPTAQSARRWCGQLGGFVWVVSISARMLNFRICVPPSNFCCASRFGQVCLLRLLL